MCCVFVSVPIVPHILFFIRSFSHIHPIYPHDNHTAEKTFKLIACKNTCLDNVCLFVVRESVLCFGYIQNESLKKNLDSF